MESFLSLEKNVNLIISSGCIALLLLFVAKGAIVIYNFKRRNI